MTPEESEAVDEYLSRYDPTGSQYLQIPLREFSHEQLCKIVMDQAAWNKANEECNAMVIHFQRKIQSLKL